MGEELVPTVSLTPAVTLDAYGVQHTIESLLELNDLAARILAARIHKEWRWKTNPYITLRLTANELDLIRDAGGTTKPRLVRYRYLAIYRHPDTGTEVKLRSIDRPPKKRSFRIPNRGRKRFRRIRLFRIQPKESEVPTKSKTKGKKKNPKAKADVDEDELEGLEELEELEADEPEDDDEDDDEDEDEAPPKRRRKRSRKAATNSGSKKKSKKAAADEDDEDEEDEDEEEEETPKKKSKKGKKGKGAKKGKSKGGTDGPGRSTKELTGGVGTQELAAAASELADAEITGRDVRVYLRKNEVEKDEEHGRYVWPSEANKTFKKLAKAIAAEYEDED